MQNSDNPTNSEPLHNHLSYEVSTPPPARSALEPKYTSNTFIGPQTYNDYNHQEFPTVHYYSNPLSASVGEPIYQRLRGEDDSYVKVEEYELPYYSHQNLLSISPSSQLYNGESNSSSYDLAFPFKNVFSSNSQPVNNFKQKTSSLQDQSTLGMNGMNYKDSFDTLITEFLTNVPSNEVPYQSFS